MPIGLNKKISQRLSLKKTVLERIDEIAYRNGMIRHTFIEKAIEYAITNKLDMKKIKRDEKIREFLKAPKNDITTNTGVNIHCEFYVAVLRASKRYGMNMKEYIHYAIAYYAIYVIPQSQPLPDAPQQ